MEIFIKIVHCEKLEVICNMYKIILVETSEIDLFVSDSLYTVITVIKSSKFT